MVKKLADFPELKQALYGILFRGECVPYNAYNHVINLGVMFGFIEKMKENWSIAISNRIFETQLYNMWQVLERFVESFTDIYYDADETFVEENGRRFFLLYLKLVINGAGNFYVEARTRNMRRTDVVIDYRGQQIVCELKIWHGQEYNTRGEEQLMDYLDSYHLTTGYMLSFNFNKKKKVGVQRIQLGEKLLIEAVV